jgi:hypothetical protein
MKYLCTPILFLLIIFNSCREEAPGPTVFFEELNDTEQKILGRWVLKSVLNDHTDPDYFFSFQVSRQPCGNPGYQDFKNSFRTLNEIIVFERSRKVTLTNECSEEEIENDWTVDDRTNTNWLRIGYENYAIRFENNDNELHITSADFIYNYVFLRNSR